MRKRFDMTLYKGMDINKDLLVSFHITFDTDGQYQTIQQKQNGISLRPSFALSISEGYQKSRMFCPSNSWFPFVNLLAKSVKLISDNIYSIFPSVGKISWDDVDKRELERFQTEKCMYINGFSIIPIVYTVCYGESCHDDGLWHQPVWFSATVVLSDVLDKRSRRSDREMQSALSRRVFRTRACLSCH